jgi:hypothetical protein
LFKSLEGVELAKQSGQTDRLGLEERGRRGERERKMEKEDF